MKTATINTLLLCMILAAGVNLYSQGIMGSYINDAMESSVVFAPQYQTGKNADLPSMVNTSANNYYQQLFMCDSADNYITAYYAYQISQSFQAMDIISDGKKSLIITKNDPDNGVVTTRFLSPSDYSLQWEVTDSGYGDCVIKTQAVNLPFTSASKTDYLVWHSSNDSIPDNTVLLQVRDKLSFSRLQSLTKEPGMDMHYFAPVDLLLYGAPIADFTGNGIYEIFKLSAPVDGGWLTPYTISMYDNFQLVDTIQFTPFMGYYTSSAHDVNNDGRPELFIGHDMTGSFYQYTQGAGLELVGAIESMSAMWRTSENLDADNGTEIIVQTDTEIITIYDAAFNMKYVLNPESGGVVIRFFAAQLNTSPNKELILVTSNDEWKTKTFIYDLSTGTAPLYIDTSNFVVAVDHFRRGVTAELIAETYDNGLAMYTFNGTLQEVWNIPASGFYSAELCGPYSASPYVITDWILQFSVLLMGGGVNGIQDADFDNDKRRDLIVYNGSYTIVDAVTGTVKDTIPDVSYPSYSFAFDLNNNLYPEIIFTNSNQEEVRVFEYDGPVNVNDKMTVPEDFALLQNYPNPFNPSTTLALSLEETGYVNLTIYNSIGQKVDQIVSGEMHGGLHQLTWNADKFASGIYIAKCTFRPLEGDKLKTASIKMLLMK